MELHEANPLTILRSINYVDSALFGVTIDIFKVRILITVCQSESLTDFGFENGGGYLCADFCQIRNLDFQIHKSFFGPPFLENGDLSAVDLFDFNFDDLKIDKVGSTAATDQLGEYRELRDIQEVQFASDDLTLRFQFVTVTLSAFDPLAFQTRHCK